jgi:hypothetical protein
MVLNKQQKKIFLSSRKGNRLVYDCKFTEKRFARTFFGDFVSPLGNIVVFETSIEIGKLEIDYGLVLIAELQKTNLTTGVCIQRLFSTMLGSLITEYTKRECYLNENVLFIEDKQCTITILKRVDENIIFHVFIPLSREGKNNNLEHIELSENLLQQFKQQAHDGFYFLTRSIFFETQQT